MAHGTDPDRPVLLLTGGAGDQLREGLLLPLLLPGRYHLLLVAEGVEGGEVLGEVGDVWLQPVARHSKISVGQMA